MEVIAASEGGRGCMIAGFITSGLFAVGFVFAPAWVGAATTAAGAALSGCFG